MRGEASALPGGLCACLANKRHTYRTVSSRGYTARRNRSTAKPSGVTVVQARQNLTRLYSCGCLALREPASLPSRAIWKLGDKCDADLGRRDLVTAGNGGGSCVMPVTSAIHALARSCTQFRTLRVHCGNPRGTWTHPFIIAAPFRGLYISAALDSPIATSPARVSRCD
jgi:hypothetical protein